MRDNSRLKGRMPELASWRNRVRARLRQIQQDLRREIRTYRLVLAHRRCPRRAKVVLGVALGYLALPFDLIPDFIPVLGQLDDVIVVPGLVWLALRAIPKGVGGGWRGRAKAELAERA